MLQLCREILSDNPLFILLNGYAAGYSSLGYANMMEEIFPFMKNKTEHGEIGIRETSRNIILPSGIFARWRNQ
jgi:23S rRNA (cytosine1962-C5)-methyltransferase